MFSYPVFLQHVVALRAAHVNDGLLEALGPAQSLASRFGSTVPPNASHGPRPLSQGEDH